MRGKRELETNTVGCSSSEMPVNSGALQERLRNWAEGLSLGPEVFTAMGKQRLDQRYPTSQDLVRKAHLLQ